MSEHLKLLRGEIKRLEYDCIESRLRHLLKSGERCDYAIHTVDTYLTEGKFDLTVLRDVHAAGQSHVRDWTAKVHAMSLKCEELLRQNKRFDKLLHGLTCWAEPFSSSLWTYSCAVIGSTMPRRTGKHLMEVRPMAALLVLDTLPGATVQVANPKRPDIIHHLQAGDIALYRQGELEIVQGGPSATVCYLGNAEDEVPVPPRRILLSNHPRLIPIVKAPSSGMVFDFEKPVKKEIAKFEHDAFTAKAELCTSPKAIHTSQLLDSACFVKAQTDAWTSIHHTPVYKHVSAATPTPTPTPPPFAVPTKPKNARNSSLVHRRDPTSPRTERSTPYRRPDTPERNPPPTALTHVHPNARAKAVTPSFALPLKPPVAYPGSPAYAPRENGPRSRSRQAGHRW